MIKAVLVLLLILFLILGCVTHNDTPPSEEQSLFGEVWIYGAKDCILWASFYDKDTNLIYKYVGPITDAEIHSLMETIPGYSYADIKESSSFEWATYELFRIDGNLLITGIPESFEQIENGAYLEDSEDNTIWQYEVKSDKLIINQLGEWDEENYLDKWTGTYNELKQAVELSKTKESCFIETSAGTRYEPAGYSKLNINNR